MSMSDSDDGSDDSSSVSYDDEEEIREEKYDKNKNGAIKDTTTKVNQVTSLEQIL